MDYRNFHNLLHLLLTDSVAFGLTVRFGLLDHAAFYGQLYSGPCGLFGTPDFLADLVHEVFLLLAFPIKFVLQNLTDFVRGTFRLVFDHLMDKVVVTLEENIGKWCTVS